MACCPRAFEQPGAGTWKSTSGWLADNRSEKTGARGKTGIKLLYNAAPVTSTTPLNCHAVVVIGVKKNKNRGKDRARSCDSDHIKGQVILEKSTFTVSQQVDADTLNAALFPFLFLS